MLYLEDKGLLYFKSKTDFEEAEDIECYSGKYFDFANYTGDIPKDFPAVYEENGCRFTWEPVSLEYFRNRVIPAISDYSEKIAQLAYYLDLCNDEIRKKE